jgi:hypothetical protein
LARSGLKQLTAHTHRQARFGAESYLQETRGNRPDPDKMTLEQRERYEAALHVVQGTDFGVPVRVTTPEEAMWLPSGTPFITPDGRKKERP